MKRSILSVIVLIGAIALTSTAFAQPISCTPTDLPTGCAIINILPAGLVGDIYLGDHLLVSGQSSSAISVEPSKSVTLLVKNIQSTEPDFNNLYIYKDSSITVYVAAGQTRTYSVNAQKKYIRGIAELKCDIKQTQPTDLVSCQVSINSVPQPELLKPGAKKRYILDPGAHILTATLVGDHASLWTPASGEKSVQINASAAPRQVSLTFNKQGLLTMTINQSNIVADLYVDGVLVASQVPTHQLYVLPSKNHKIEAKNITDPAANDLYRWKDASGIVYLAPASARTHTFKLVKEWLKGFLEISCTLTNYPNNSGAYCQPNIDGTDVTAISAGAKQQYVLDPGNHKIIVIVAPAAQWPSTPLVRQSTITAGRTTRITASFRYTAPPTPTVPPTPISPPCNCGGPDLDCSNFSTHNQAQACFNYCVSQGWGDVFGLDGDNDQLACESLP